MTKNSIILTLLLALNFSFACGQNSKSRHAEKFLDFLNTYQIDSLLKLVADNFKLTRTYATYSNDKKSLLDKYVPNSKNFNAKYLVIKSTNNEQTTNFLVEDRSDYLKYLNINYPKWKIKITTNRQGRVESMIIDTTESYQSYLIQMKKKSEQFESWMKQKYPTETREILYNTEGLLTRRLKEYSRSK
jgi:hypothetical protein